MIHFFSQELISDRHPISVALIGAGGTGSQVLPHLARIHTALQALGKQGLQVTVFDEDRVSEANMARQLFSPQDIMANKAIVQVSRLNRFYGFQWKAVPFMFNTEVLDRPNYADTYNFYISCVDSLHARKVIFDTIKASAEHKKSYFFSGNETFYWLDTGNMKDYGQVIISTLKDIRQPASKYETLSWLPTIFEIFPDMEDKQTENAPSCSLAEAIGKQDLFINTTVACHAGQLLWSFLHDGYLTSQGSFINLATGKTNPIHLKRYAKQDGG